MKKYTRVIELLLIAVLLCGCLNLEASASDLGDSLNGTWYFTSYEYLKYISTPDRQKLHVQADIDDDCIVLHIDRDGSTEVVESPYFFNDGGINFAIENDASYLLKPDENGNLFMYGSDEGKKFPGFKYIFSREPAAPAPAIGSNPDYWWEGDWVIYHAYDREKMENSLVEGRLSFGAYLDTDVNYANICFPDGTVAEYTYDFLPDLMLLNDSGHISVKMGENGIGSFSYGGVDYSFARTVPAQPEKEERFYDVNVFIHDADSREFIAYGAPVRVSLDNTPQTLPEEMIPQTFEYNGRTYDYDPAVCTAPYNAERHGYEVYMKLKEEPVPTEEPAAAGEAYIPVNPWLYTGDNFEGILKSLIAQRDWSPDYTFEPSDNSFTVYDGAGAAMPGRFLDEGGGAYSAVITMGGVERTLYADDFHGYATEWDKLTVDAEHEYLDALIQAMIRKEEKESWWIELNDDGTSGIAEDRDDNEVPFTYEFALSEEGEEYVKLTYNEKTIDNISLRK